MIAQRLGVAVAAVRLLDKLAMHVHAGVAVERAFPCNTIVNADVLHVVLHIALDWSAIAQRVDDAPRSTIASDGRGHDRVRQ